MTERDSIERAVKRARKLKEPVFIYWERFDKFGEPCKPYLSTISSSEYHHDSPHTEEIGEQDVIACAYPTGNVELFDATGQVVREFKPRVS